MIPQDPGLSWETLLGPALVAGAGHAASTGAVAINLTDEGVASGGAVGRPAIYDTGTLTPAHRVYVNDVICPVRVGTLKISRAAGRVTNVGFEIFDALGTNRPALWSRVVVYSAGTREFDGFVVEVEEWNYQSNVSNGYRVNCVDFSILFDYRYVAKRYDTIIGGFEGPVVEDIVVRFLDGTGIWFDKLEWICNTQLYEQIFNYCTVTEALNRIMDVVNGNYWVDAWRQLHTFPKDTGYENAPYSFADDDGRWADMRVSRNGRTYSNKCGVRNNIGRKGVWIDTVAGKEPNNDLANWIFPVTFPLVSMPIVRLNGEVQVVALSIGVPITEYHDFYYTQGSFHINRNRTLPALVEEDVVEIEQVCDQLSYIHWESDATEIAAHGRFEFIEEVKDFPTEESLQAEAAGLLLRRKQTPTDITVRTRLDGFRPGQLLTINTTRPAVNGTFLIQSVESQEVAAAPAHLYYWHTIKASDSSLKSLGGPDRYFGKLIERSRQPLDRISQVLRFNVAGTIRGVTNPGLETGVGEGIQTSQRKGVLGWCKLLFKSIEDGTPTTSDIELDVYLGGSTIFGTTKLVIPAGSITPAIQWTFATEPLEVPKDGKFTFEVLQADSAAKDGVLEIYVIG